MVDVERRQGAPMRVIMSGGGTATAVDSAALLLPFTFVLCSAASMSEIPASAARPADGGETLR